MPTVLCPSCGEKGRIPDSFIGHSIRCGKCSNRFMVQGPTSGAPTVTPLTEAVPAVVVRDGIVVEGIDDATWSANPTQPETHAVPALDAHEETSHSFTKEQHAAAGTREYKLLTQKDKFFAGKFEFNRLEDAINHYARQGWVVRAITTPQVTGFSGGAKEEIVVLLER